MQKGSISLALFGGQKYVYFFGTSGLAISTALYLVPGDISMSNLFHAPSFKTLTKSRRFC
jgi:hypothetical protein